MFQRQSLRSAAALGLALSAGGIHLASIAAPPVPPAAATVIAQVNAAATHKDFTALQALMTPEFIWSYGGDASAAGALANWESHPKVLKELQRITGSPCAVKSALVECAEPGKSGYRAGFKQTPAGWRMVYFVEGE